MNSAQVEELRSFVHLAVRGLADRPEGVRAEILDPSGEKSVCVVISCEPSDLGLIIGKSGRNIQALRTLVCSIATKLRLKATLMVRE